MRKSKTGLVKEEEVKEYLIKKAERVYPILDLEYRKNLKKVLSYTDKIKNLTLLGRQGLFNYNNMDHCIDMSKRIASVILFYAKNHGCFLQ